MNLNIDQLMADIKTTSTTILNKDITEVRGFSNRQLHGIATQAALVSTGIATGQIKGSLRDFFLDQLVELTRNFVNTLVGLLLSTIEKLWNAVVNLIWSSISKATGTALPIFKPI